MRHNTERRRIATTALTAVALAGLLVAVMIKGYVFHLAWSERSGWTSPPASFHLWARGEMNHRGGTRQIVRPASRHEALATRRQQLLPRRVARPQVRRDRRDDRGSSGTERATSGAGIVDKLAGLTTGETISTSFALSGQIECRLLHERSHAARAERRDVDLLVGRVRVVAVPGNRREPQLDPIQSASNASVRVSNAKWVRGSYLLRFRRSPFMPGWVVVRPNRQ